MRTLVSVPSPEEVAAWRSDVVLVIEGLFLHVDKDSPRTGQG